MKTLTDFRKTVETGVDPRLGVRANEPPLSLSPCLPFFLPLSCFASHSTI